MSGFTTLSHNEIAVTLIQFSMNTHESRNVVVINLSANMLIEESRHTPEKLIPKLQCFTLNEVANHGDASDCWIIIYDRVYRITDFLDKHPGGKDLLLEYAEKDASFAFRGTGHSQRAIQSLKQYEIGELISQQQIFRKNATISIKDLPE